MSETERIVEDTLIHERKKKLIHWITHNSSVVGYLGLILVIFVGLYIRTRNLAGLRDISTGGWTLGPDLDPFLFLRWADYIIQHGSLMVVDTMRYVPIGFETKAELILLPYLIAWFHKIAVIFGSVSIEQSAALFPVAMFALTIIAFFFLVRKIFLGSMGQNKAIIIALIASLFLSVIPSLLPRTIAGIPEKESAAFFFMFLAFYLFLVAWKSDKIINKILFAVGAGISTAMMALVWGGYTYIFITLGVTMFLAFLLGQTTKDKIYLYLAWILSASIIMIPLSIRYTPRNLMVSITTGLAFFVILLLLTNSILKRPQIKKYIEQSFLKNIPFPLISILVTLIFVLIVSTLFFGVDFIPGQIDNVVNQLVTPVSDRLSITVAENKQPFFTEWSGSFGPVVSGIPILFWLFFIGSIYLFQAMLNSLQKKEKWALTSAYTFFLVAIIFSRYDPSSMFNGTNAISLLLYSAGFVVLIGTAGKYYHSMHKTGEIDKLKRIDIGLILLFTFFFLSIVSARGAVRVIMVLVPPAAIMVSYLAVAIFTDVRKTNNDLGKFFGWVAFGIVILGLLIAANSLYTNSKEMAKSYIPATDNHRQWQNAMAWVRENTPETAVFGHWWDYGYWVQSLGERATVLDGGNLIAYWDHLMGRYALTAPKDQEIEALEFLYTHNTTHFLIDPSDIGKYGAFSSIGSDQNYDRRSWLAVFLRNEQSTQDLKNTTLYLYQGGFPLDGDLAYTEANGTNILLPEGLAGVGAILVERNKSGTITSAPKGIFVYQRNGVQQQYNLPLRYAFDSGRLKDFEYGVDAGVVFMPRLVDQGNGQSIDSAGALIYLSNKTVDSQLARLYLYKEKNPYFEEVHSEDSYVVGRLKEMNAIQETQDFVYYNGINGPLTIWEIHYPAGIQTNETYLQTTYPDRSLTVA